ncbi:hypothetical protein L7F22_013986 [Adiantum nelumboides]|nr:hypothetical protein [Adiantum nelumboides]
MDALLLIKDCLHEDFEDARCAWEGPAPSMEVRIPVQELMDPVAQYALNAVILFFPGKMPTAQDVGQWVDSLLKRQAVRGVYFGARGFYEILLTDMNARDALLEMSPLFFNMQMTHVLPWALTKDYQSLIRPHKCLVWVEVVDFPRTWHHFLPLLATQLGKVICPSKLDANTNRFCVLWDTDIPTPSDIAIDFGKLQPPPSDAPSTRSPSIVKSSLEAQPKGTSPSVSTAATNKGKAKQLQSSSLSASLNAKEAGKEQGLSSQPWMVPKKSVKVRPLTSSCNYVSPLKNLVQKKLPCNDNTSLAEAWDKVVRSYKEVLTGDALHRRMLLLDLIMALDLWPLLHPDDPSFTFQHNARSLYHARLDRWKRLLHINNDYLKHGLFRSMIQDIIPPLTSHIPLDMDTAWFRLMHLANTSSLDETHRAELVSARTLLQHNDARKLAKWQTRARQQAFTDKGCASKQFFQHLHHSKQSQNIKKIKLSSKEWTSSLSEPAQALQSHYGNIFRVPLPLTQEACQARHLFLLHVTPIVSIHQTHDLEAVLTESELHASLHDCDWHKLLWPVPYVDFLGALLAHFISQKSSSAFIFGQSVLPPKRLGGLNILDLRSHVLARKAMLLSTLVQQRQPWTLMVSHMCTHIVPPSFGHWQPTYWEVIFGQLEGHIPGCPLTSSLFIDWKAVTLFIQWNGRPYAFGNSRRLESLHWSKTFSSTLVLCSPHQAYFLSRKGISPVQQVVDNTGQVLSFADAVSRYSLEHHYSSLWREIQGSLANFLPDPPLNEDRLSDWQLANFKLDCIYATNVYALLQSDMWIVRHGFTLTVSTFWSLMLLRLLYLFYSVRSQEGVGCVGAAEVRGNPAEYEEPRGTSACEVAARRGWGEAGVDEHAAVDEGEISEPEEEEAPCSGDTGESRSVGGSSAEGGGAGANVEGIAEVVPEYMWRRESSKKTTERL